MVLGFYVLGSRLSTLRVLGFSGLTFRVLGFAVLGFKVSGKRLGPIRIW